MAYFHLHNIWLTRTIIVKEGRLAEAYKAFNRMLSVDDVFGKHRRTRYCEKPTAYRRRKSYEISRAILDEELSRKIKLISRQNREDPWIGG